MTRVVDRLEGLALPGRGSVGPLSFELPALLESRADGVPDGTLSLRSLDAPSGTRSLRIARHHDVVDLTYPIATPEIVPPVRSAVRAGPTAWIAHAPLSPETVEELRADRPELIVLGNARALWAEGRPFVTAIGALRAGVGAGPILWTPRVALPHRLPLLAYLGVDLVDTTEGLLAASEGIFLDPTLGAIPSSDVASETCDCPVCASEPPGSRSDHALAMYRRSMAQVRAASRTGRLRELVEARLVAEPALAEMLRYADRDLADLLEVRTPVVAARSRNYVLSESQRRPEVARFRRRLLERYRPPPSKRILLLVPCSQRKPYRASRSHRRFASALEGVMGARRVHVVSVSSPLGLVPQELEDVPPARHYDIPVTGDWSEDERRAVAESLRHLLSAGNYRSVVVHLDPREYGFLRAVLPTDVPVTWTLTDDHTTTAVALAALREAVVRAVDDGSAQNRGPLEFVREELREVAAIQFGRAAADRLFSAPLRLAGRPWFHRLTDGRSDLATLREERGLFHLTVAGARRILPDATLTVEIDPGVALEGDLFAPGVRTADPAIRLGDAVVLTRDGEVAGVGEAALPGPLMTQLGHGLAVRVRHRAHAPTDTTMTEERSSESHGPVV